jgi:hypothetical protein
MLYLTPGEIEGKIVPKELRQKYQALSFLQLAEKIIFTGVLFDNKRK